MMITDDINALINNIDSMPTLKLKHEIDQLSGVFERIDLGLSRAKSRTRHYDKEQQAEAIRMFEAVRYASIALQLRMEFVRRTGSADDRAKEALACMRFGKDFSFFGEFNGGIGTGIESLARDELSRILGTLDARQCRRIANLLVQQNAQRPALEELVYSRRIADQNKDWTIHLQLLLQEWSEQETYEWRRLNYRNRVAQTRLLILRLALQSYFLEKERLPDSLSEIVGEYLPAIPDDPFRSGPLQYQKIAFGFMLYSVGPDETDKSDDIVVVGPIRSKLLQKIGQEGKRLFDKLGF